MLKALHHIRRQIGRLAGIHRHSSRESMHACFIRLVAHGYACRESSKREADRHDGRLQAEIEHMDNMVVVKRKSVDMKESELRAILADIGHRQTGLHRSYKKSENHELLEERRHKVC